MSISLADISGLILAGGRGSRLGGVDKGLVQIHERPLIAYVIDRFAPQVATLLINANRHIKCYEAFGYPVINDEIPDYAGPLAGIAAGLAICKTPYLATVPCDSPFFPNDLVARLAQTLSDSDDASVAVVYAHRRPQPVFALLKVELQETMSEFLTAGGRKILGYYQQQGLVRCEIAAEDEVFSNINDAGDLHIATLHLST